MTHRVIPLTLGLLLSAIQPGFAQMSVPQLVFDGAEKYLSGGQPFTRYKFKVLNATAFSSTLFAPAPDLPPCGNNKNSARSWVDIYTGTKRLNGFCALKSPEELNGLWFAVPGSQAPPPWVYFTLTDRQSNQIVTSNPVTIPAQ